MEHRSQFYISTGITFGVLLMVMLTTFFLTCNDNDGEALANYQVISMAETISGWASFIYTIVMIVAASQFFSDGKLKSGRIHVLTTPVSMFENWLARVCLFVVAYIIMFHVVFNVVELLRALLMTTVHYEGPMLWGGIGHISFYSDQYWEIWFYFTAFYAFLITTYMLGSVVFFAPIAAAHHHHPAHFAVHWRHFHAVYWRRTHRKRPSLLLLVSLPFGGQPMAILPSIV